MWYLIIFEIIPWSGLIAVAEVGNFDNYRQCAAVQRELVVRVKELKMDPKPVPLCVNIEKLNEKDW